MEDLSDKLEAILSNPQTLGAIGELAKKLMSENENAESESNDISLKDLDKLRNIPEIAALTAHYEKYRNDRIPLLLAIKPFLDDEKKKKTDSVINILKTIEFIGNIGLIQEGK